MAFTNGNDVNILQASDSLNVGAGLGDDKYILSGTGLTAGQQINITDTQGVNTLQLIGGLTIASSKVAANAIQLTLSNGAIVNVFGADTFKYEVGGDPLTGTSGTIQNFSAFVTNSLGATVPTGSTLTDGATNVGVNANGTTTVGGPTPTVPTFSVTGAAAAAEGTDASFVVSLAARATGVSYSVNVALAGTGGATAGTDFTNALTLDAASTAAGITLVGNVLTIPAASTVSSVTLKTAVTTDSISPETGEGLSLTLSSPTGAGAVIGTANTVTTSITDAPVSYTLSASAASGYEGSALTYTITASAPVTADTVVAFSVVAGDAAAANQGTSNTNLNDFSSGSFNPTNVTILAGTKTATFSVIPAVDTITELPEGFSVKAVVTGGPTLTATGTVLDGNGLVTGQTFTLTPNVDNGAAFTGGAADDIFNAAPYFNTTTSTNVATFTALDALDGGGGNNTLNITDTTAAFAVPTSATVKNIQTANIIGAGTSNGDVTGWTGLTTLNVTETGGSGGGAYTAAATTDVKLTDTAAAATTISVQGGKNVNVTANGVTAGGTINVGTVTAVKGTLDVTANMLASQTVTATADAINTKGGTVVTINANLGQTYDAGKSVTGGDIGVTGTTDTTTVTVNQTAVVAASDATVKTAGVNAVVAVTAAPGVNGVAAVTAVTNVAATAAAVSGVAADGKVTIADSTAGALGTIKTVTLSNYGAGSKITSNALTDLSLSGTAGTLTLDRVAASGASDTLNLTLNKLSGTNTITDTNNEIKTLNVTTGTTASTLAAFADTGLTTLNVAGSSVLTLTAVNASLTKIAVTGAAGFSGDVSALGAGLASFTTTSSGKITAVLDAATQTFKGSTGQDVISISADAKKAITGGSGSTDVIVLNAAAATFNADSNKYTTTNVTGFEVLGASTGTSGTFDFTTLPTGLKSIELFGAVTAGTAFTKVPTGSALAIDAAQPNAFTYQVADATGPADSLALTLGTSSTGAGFAVADLTLKDANNVGLGTLNVVSNGSTFNTNHTISKLTDNGLSTLNVSGTAGLTITDLNQASTQATAFTINNTTTGAAPVIISTLTDASLGSLTFTGSNASTVSSLAGLTGKVLTIANTGTSTATVTAIAPGLSTESNDVTFSTLNAGESITLAGRTVAATGTAASYTAADVATVFAGGTVTGLTGTGALAGWTATTTGATAGHAIFTSTTAGTNVADLSTLYSEAGLTAPTAIGAGTPTNGNTTNAEEFTTWTMLGLTVGQSYTLAGLTVTAQKTLTATEVAAAFTAGTTSAGNYTVTGTLAAPSGWTGPVVFNNVADALKLTNGSTGGAFANVLDFTSAPAGNSTSNPTDPTYSVTQGGVSGSAQSLQTINLTGNVALGANTTTAEPAIGGTTGITVNGATDHAHVNIQLNAAGATYTNSTTLGNANNFVTDLTSAGTANVTVGTGYNLIDVSNGGNNATFAANVTLGAHTNTVALYDKVLVSPTGTPTSGISATITGVATGDVIVFKDAADVAFVTLTAANQNSITAQTNLAGAITTAFGLLGTAHNAAAFQYGGDTYVIENVGADTTFAAGTDSVIKLTGLHTVGDFGTVNGAVTVLS